MCCSFFFQAEDGIRDIGVTGVQTCALPISGRRPAAAGRISTAAVRRDRLRDGWEGRRGRWPGGPPLRPLLSGGGGGRRGPPPRGFNPPAAGPPQSPGRGRPTPRPPPPPPRPPPPRDRTAHLLTPGPPKTRTPSFS